MGTLPLDRPVAVRDLLLHYVELGQPATRAQIALLAPAAACPPERAELERLGGPAFEEVIATRLSVLDHLERHPSVLLDVGAFLGMLPSMRVRQYSISSSPMWRPDRATVTVAVVDTPALAGEGRFRGVASSFLASLLPGDLVSVAVRPSNAAFRPPADPTRPMVMICAGSGVAPFRGFVQERAAQKDAGMAVGEVLLFFGMDAPDVDVLYREEFARWERDGVVSVLSAFSEAPQDGVRFVQERVGQERERIADLFAPGGDRVPLRGRQPDGAGGQVGADRHLP